LLYARWDMSGVEQARAADASQMFGCIVDQAAQPC
jgi:hypothetical protein